MVMFLLSFVTGSQTAEGGKNPLADMDRGASGFGPGGPILEGSKSARTPAQPLGHFLAPLKVKYRQLARTSLAV